MRDLLSGPVLTSEVVMFMLDLITQLETAVAGGDGQGLRGTEVGFLLLLKLVYTQSVSTLPCHAKAMVAPDDAA